MVSADHAFLPTAANACPRPNAMLAILRAYRVLLVKLIMKPITVAVFNHRNSSLRIVGHNNTLPNEKDDATE